MRISVYTIASDEEKFVPRWAAATADADHRLVVDTGSTDATIDRLTEHGVTCQSISIQPFRFDDARNAALAMLPECDVVVSLDMDEVLTPDWRSHIERSWQGTRLRYGYVWSWTDAGQPDVTFETDKIVGRHTHRWRHPVHEILVPTVPEVISVCQTTLIEHRADPRKPRHYLSLLRVAVEENPLDSRTAHLLGREYYFHGQHDEAIAELQRHLTLSNAKWPAERAMSMRFIGKCYQAKGELTKAYRWFVRATLEDSSREPLIDAACCCLAQNAFHATIDFAQRALALAPSKTYMAERYANQEGPYDLAARAHYHLGNRQKAVALATKALAFSPHDSRLQDNLKMVGG